MKIRIKIIDNVNVLYIQGAITIDSIQIIEVIAELLKYKKLNVLINFEKVESMDYQGLAIIVIAYKNILNNKGKIKFCNVSNSILGFFRIAHLDGTFEIYDDEKVAIKSFRRLTSAIEKMQLRRRYKRLDLHGRVMYRLAARPKKSYRGTLLNMGGAGIYLRCKTTFPVKTRLLLTLRLSGEVKPIRARGIIVWEADREVQPHAYPGMGISFIEISSSAQKKLLEFIDRNISHRSGSGLYSE